MPDLYQPADAAARETALGLITSARHAALAYTAAADGLAAISRVAFGLDRDGGPLTLISALAPHFAGLQAHPTGALLLGEVGERGDPLTHPRLMLRFSAQFLAPDDPARPALRAQWLKGHPKAALYVDFADFAFVRLHPLGAILNAGFARAYHLGPRDLLPFP